MVDGRAAGSALTPELQVGIARSRDELAALHAELVRRGAFPGTGVTISARVPGAGLQLVSPPVFPDGLRPESLILCDLDGVAVADTPGSDQELPEDARLHGALYRRDPGVGGIVRLRAPHVCAWAAREQPIPCVLDVVAEQFGGDIPVGPAPLDDVDDFAEAIIDTLDAVDRGRASALVLPRDGLLAVGADARAAAHAAALAEGAAAAVDLAGASVRRLPENRVRALAAADLVRQAAP